MSKNIIKYLFICLIIFFSFNINTYALSGIVNVNDSLSLRSSASSSSSLITKFYNGTELEILNTNAGTGNGCDDSWYQVKYGNYEGYSCGTFINLVNENASDTEDDTYNRNNYKNKPNGDGTIMCYEDTGSIGLRSSVGGSRTGKVVDCGEEVDILETVEKPKTTCPYYYKIRRGKDEGYICGYFVNTTKLSSTAEAYYKNNSKGETIDSYKKVLSDTGFPESYHPYLLELHARHDNWQFIKEDININFDDAVIGESGNGASLLQGEKDTFNKGYLSTASHSYNLWTDSFIEYESEPGYYNASREAIAYYMDSRNYLNEKYIFAFETLGYSTNQNANIVKSILSAQSFWPSVYNYYTLTNAIQDSRGNVNDDIVHASSNIGISAVHVASRIKQEMTGVSTTSSRLGGSFTYNGSSYENYYNFFNIKSRCTNCSSIYSGYAYEKGWNTPYKGLYGGASFMYDGYISLNQDTIYYEKFDVSTTNGHYTHQYMQNLAAPIQEGGIKYNGYINSVSSYLDTDITFVIPVYKNMPENTVTAPKLGSPNNYLKELTVNGKSVSNFSYNTYNYNVYLASNTKSVDIAATKMVSTSNVNGIGNIEIKEDNQINRIVVTSQNGKTRTYTINFIREESKVETVTVKDAMNNSGSKYNDNYLFGINIGTNVSQIIGNISNYNHTVEVVVKDKNGSIKTNDSFRTGDTVTIAGSDGKKTYTTVIYGDTSGDGKITSLDYMKIKNHILKSSNLSGAYQQAADTNKDGKITALDYMKVKNNILGSSKIEQ